jgi:hypothetical protein
MYEIDATLLETKQIQIDREQTEEIKWTLKNKN